MRGRNVVFLLVAVFAVGWFACMRLYWDIYASPIRGSDFSSYYTAGTLVRTGQGDDLYTVAPGDSVLGDATAGPWAEVGAAAGVPRQHYYIYPPFFALLFVPLSLLPFPVLLDLWLGLDLVLVGLFLALYARHRGASLTWPEAAFMVSVCFFEFLPLIWAMAIGQTSFIVLALLAGTLIAWRRGADGLSGLLLGLAVGIKLTPALLTLFFWWRGKRRIAVISAVVFALTQLISLAALGWEPHRRFYFELLPMMSGGTCYFLNQSLGAALNRLLTDGDVRQVALIDSAPARTLALIVSALLLVFTARRVRRRRIDLPLGEEIQFGAVVLLTLIISPISWSHHYLVALLPLFALAGYLGRQGRVPWTSVLLVGIAYLLVGRKPHPDLFLTGLPRLFNSAALAGALILWGLSMRALRPPGAAAPPRVLP